MNDINTTEGNAEEVKASEPGAQEACVAEVKASAPSASERCSSKGKCFKDSAVKTGISFGSALAMVISFSTWHSVGWAIVHGLMSWFYVVYYVLKYAHHAA